jgi:hypothetical protein
LLKRIVAPTPFTRRRALQAGAVAAIAGALRPAGPALAARPASLFELDLAGVTGQDASVASAGAWRTTAVLRAPRRFDLIGLRWANGARAEAQVRARPRGGRWTRWVDLHVTGDHGPDGDRTAPAGTDPAFTGAADEFQLRLRGNPPGLRARFVRALPTANVARRIGRRLRRRAGAAAAPRRRRAQGVPPTIITRSEWGADAVPPRGGPTYGEVQMAFVHHTVNANDYGPEDSAGIVLGITRYHRDSNGWNDVGYNFLVDKYGQIFEGRSGGIDLPVVGAQAQGYNSVSTGIACLGTFTSVVQTPEGLDALARIIGWKLSLHAVPTSGSITVISAGGPSNRYGSGTPVTFERISGHRDGNATSCPGNALYGQLPALREAAARYANPVAGLTIFAPAKVRGVRSIDVSGYLRFADGSSASGLPVDLEFQTSGAAWSHVARTSAGADGSYRVPLPDLAVGGRMRAVFVGDATRARMESPERRIEIVPSVRMTVDKGRLRRGQTVQISGTASPAEQVRLVLERRSGRRWIRERNRLLRVRDGAFRAKLRPRRRAKYRVRVQVGGVKRRRLLSVR